MEVSEGNSLDKSFYVERVLESGLAHLASLMLEAK
jgi:hypothetical protein